MIPISRRFNCVCFLPYRLYSGSRKAGKKILLFVTLPAILLAILLAQLLGDPVQDKLMLPVIFVAVISFVFGIVFILTSNKKIVDVDLYKAYIDNYYTEFTDRYIIISRSKCQPLWLKQYYPPIMQEVYSNVNGVDIAVSRIPAESIRGIRVVETYIGRTLHGSGNLRNYLYIVEIKTVSGKYFILSDQLEDGLKEYVLSNYYDLVENPDDDAWHKRSQEKMSLKPVAYCRNFHICV